MSTCIYCAKKTDKLRSAYYVCSECSATGNTRQPYKGEVLGCSGTGIVEVFDALAKGHKLKILSPLQRHENIEYIYCNPQMNRMLAKYKDGKSDDDVVIDVIAFRFMSFVEYRKPDLRKIILNKIEDVKSLTEKEKEYLKKLLEKSDED